MERAIIHTGNAERLLLAAAVLSFSCFIFSLVFSALPWGPAEISAGGSPSSGWVAQSGGSGQASGRTPKKPGIASLATYADISGGGIQAFSGVRAAALGLIFLSCTAALLVSVRKSQRTENLIRALENRNRELNRKWARRTIGLRERNRCLQESARRMQIAGEEKNRLLLMAAHDLKNPLAGIISLTGHLEKQTPTAEAAKRELLQYIDQASRKALSLVHNLLEASKSDFVLEKPATEVLDLAGLIGESMELLRPMASRKQIRFECRLPLVPCFARTNRRVMFQILDNLISNAIKFSPSGKIIRIMVQEGEGGLALVVEDEGPGIKPEEESLLFQDFTRLAARPTGQESSTGLGLAAARRYATMIGGELEFERTGRPGARFVLRFPALS